MHPDVPRIILVEDDADLRESIIEGLTLSGFQVTGVGSGREFYRAMDAAEPFAVAVIDIGLPDQSGLVLAEYCRANTNLGIIILTARDSDEDRFNGYEAGCDLYLTKPFPSRVLASAITRLVERLPSFKAADAETGVAAKDSPVVRWTLERTSWSLLSPDGEVLPMTSKEMQFLSLLLETPGEPVARELMLQKLYPRMDEYTGRALDALVRRLRAKSAQAGGETIPVKTVHGVGYCLAEPFGVL